MSPVRVFLLDDSPEFLAAAASFLAADPHIQVVGQARSAEEALEGVTRDTPDVVLATLELPRNNGLVAAVRMKALPKPPRVIILSDHQEPPYRALADAIQADDFVLKRDFCQRVPAILRRRFPLPVTAAAPRAAERPRAQPHGDLTELNAGRLILDSVGGDILRDVVGDYLELIGTSAAVYEKDGSYALGILSSGWCSRMDAASRGLCGTDDNREALACGRWHCHESCWQTSRRAIETGRPADEACLGGINIHAVPIRVGGEVVGALNFGYGDPPADPETIRELAERYGTDPEGLRLEAAAYRPRSAFVIDVAKSRLATAAHLIGQIVERRQAQEDLQQRNRLATLSADVGLALTRTEGVPEMLQQCAASVVRNLDAAFARVWTLGPGGDVLELQASAGRYTHADGGHSHVPVGQFKIGLIAQECRPHLTNDVLSDPCIDREWARREGLVAFAGYPLLVDGRAVGVMAMFARRPLSGFALEALGHVADVIALGIERKRSREELARSEERLQSFVARAQDVIFDLGSDGAFLSLNPAFEAVTGWPASDWLGRRFQRLLHPDDVERGTALFAQVMANQTPPRFEMRINSSRGEPVTMEINVVPWTEKGVVVGAHGIARDRNRAEQELRLRDRALLAVSQGLLITDPALPDNPIIYASPGFERLTGYTAAEVLGRNCRFLQGADTDPAAVTRVREAVQGGEPVTAELLNYRKDGSAFWNELSISPVRDEAGRLTHFVGVQADVTGRRRLEEQFRQAQKMEAVGRLAGGVAHDFNNLLTVINGYSELALGQLRAGDPLAELIGQIHRAGERAGLLTRQLLTFSRKQVVQPEVLDLNALLADMQKMLGRLIGEDIDLAVSPAPGLWRVRADTGQLEQVVMNLAVNARDAMPTGGRLTVETANVVLDAAYAEAHTDARAGEYVLLAVSDTGCGMDAATQARIFEPFFTTKGADKGTGLGLATVFGIVKQSGGHIAVYSEPSVGTTFKVYLPRYGNGEPAGKSHQGLRPAPRGSETVLLVEDEDGVRALARTVLQQHGYRVLAARHGGEALVLCEEQPGAINLLVTDVVMPVLSGPQLAQRLRSRLPGFKVLLLSGYTDDAVIRHGILEADTAFLQKPFSTDALVRKVREVLDGSEP